MDVFEAIKGRRSIRKYKKDEVIDRNILEEIVDAGKYAASARAEYPWKFVVIISKDRLKQLAEIVGSNGRFIADASAAIVVICKDTKYYLEDGSAAVQNMLLAAYAKGIGTCWVAGDKKEYSDRVLSFINAPKGYKLINIISCGIPDEKPVKPKPDLKDILVWEKL
jgi:nitroreductase